MFCREKCHEIDYGWLFSRLVLRGIIHRTRDFSSKEPVMTTSHLGAYELQQHLASDPLSDMWKAFDLQNHRYVTIKIFRFDAQTAPHLLPGFLHEAQHLKP